MPAHDEASRSLAEQAARDNVSPRASRIDRLERVSRGDQYGGRPHFFFDGAPVLERAPCVVYDLVDQAIRSHASMVVGEGRFPTLTTHADEDNEELEDDFGLSKEDSAILDRFVGAAAKKARLRPTSRRLLESALRTGTACALPAIVRGELKIEAIPAKRCNPAFVDDDPEADLAKIEVRYPYLKEETINGRTEVLALLYRRVVDDRFDTVYAPVRANRGGAEPTFWPIRSRTEHGLGFCPALWYRCSAEDSTLGEIDGRALHQNLLDELYALDLSRSQVHRGVISTLDPILAELGVEPGFQPAPTADGPRLDIAQDPLKDWRSYGSRPAWQAGRGRKRAPGMAYQYPVGASVELLCLPGDAFKAGFDNVDELKRAIQSALHWCPSDQEQAKGVAGPLSGKAREWIYRKQIEYDDELRSDFGDRCLLRLVDLVLRIVLAAHRKGDVRIPGVRTVVPILSRFAIDQEIEEGGPTVPVWVPPTIDLIWPPYFQSGDDDQKLVADTVRADLAANIILPETALRKLAPWYGISDVTEYAEQLEKKKREDAAALHEANAMLAGAGKEPDGDEEGDGSTSIRRGPPKPPAAKAPTSPPAASSDEDGPE